MIIGGVFHVHNFVNPGISHWNAGLLVSWRHLIPKRMYNIFNFGLEKALISVSLFQYTVSDVPGKHGFLWTTVFVFINLCSLFCMWLTMHCQHIFLYVGYGVTDGPDFFSAFYLIEGSACNVMASGTLFQSFPTLWRYQKNEKKVAHNDCIFTESWILIELEVFWSYLWEACCYGSLSSGY